MEENEKKQDFHKNGNSENPSEEKLKEIAEKLNKQRLCIPFTSEEMKKLEIAFNYKYNANKKSLIAEKIKKDVMREVEEILTDMRENFFKW